MNSQIKFMLDYQGIDALIKNIDDEVKKSEVSQQYFTAKKFLSTVTETLTNLENRAKGIVDSHELAKKEIKDLNELALEYASSIEGLTSEDEINYTKKKLQETLDLISSLESKVNSITKEMEGVLKEFNLLRAKNNEMKALRDEMFPKVKELTDSKKAEKDNLTKQKEELEKSIDKELLDKYTLKRKDNKFPVLVEAIMGKDSCNCSACGMSMISTVKSSLSSGNIVECESCKKLLYAKD